MFTVLTGHMSEDNSANARIFQTIIIITHFLKNPMSIIIGTGSVSNHWNNGYDSIFGYFYPSDTGFLGGLFIYGIIGSVFIVLIPFIISFKTIIKIPNQNSAFIVTIKYMLIFSLISSIHGSFYFNIMTYINKHPVEGIDAF
jgi:hypothetical protein